MNRCESGRYPAVDDGSTKIGIVAVGKPSVKDHQSTTMYDWNFPRPFKNEMTSPRAREMYEIERNMREADARFRAARRARRASRRRSLKRS